MAKIFSTLNLQLRIEYYEREHDYSVTFWFNTIKTVSVLQQKFADVQLEGGGGHPTRKSWSYYILLFLYIYILLMKFIWHTQILATHLGPPKIPPLFYRTYFLNELWPLNLTLLLIYISLPELYPTILWKGTPPAM